MLLNCCRTVDLLMFQTIKTEDKNYYFVFQLDMINNLVYYILKTMQNSKITNQLSRTMFKSIQ